MTVDAHKINLVQWILSIQDERLLKNITTTVSREFDAPLSNPPDPFKAGEAKLRSGVTADEVFAEQAKKPLTYGELREIVKDVEWDYSLDEVLETIR